LRGIEPGWLDGDGIDAEMNSGREGANDGRESNRICSGSIYSKFLQPYACHLLLIHPTLAWPQMDAWMGKILPPFIGGKQLRGNARVLLGLLCSLSLPFEPEFCSLDFSKFCH
jgi:hypothetical protein